MMNWQDIIKVASTNNSQGLHVTKFYMFLKRWLSDTHTEQFSKYFMSYDELGDPAKRRVYWALKSLLIFEWKESSQSMFEPNNEPSKDDDGNFKFPGINVRNLDEYKLDLVFDDALHISERNKWVDNSAEMEHFGLRTEHSKFKHIHGNYMPWWYKDPPYDHRLQEAWNQLSSNIKRSKNYGGSW
jgi:hypothetical protein